MGDNRTELKQVESSSCGCDSCLLGLLIQLDANHQEVVRVLTAGLTTRSNTEPVYCSVSSLVIKVIL